MNTVRTDSAPPGPAPASPRRSRMDLAREDLDEARECDERAWAILFPNARTRPPEITPEPAQ